MKYFTLLALLGLINSTQAIRFTDIPSEESADVTQHIQQMAQEDSTILSDMDKKIDQAKRNVAQGELGRTLAMNKINDIKLSLAQFKSHFKELTEHAVADPQGEDVAPISVDKKRQSLSQLEQKSKQVI